MRTNLISAFGHYRSWSPIISNVQHKTLFLISRHLLLRPSAYHTNQNPEQKYILSRRCYMSEPAVKRARMAGDAGLVIGTHNGHFHADEALAVFLLRLLPDYRDASLIRTRDPAVLKKCDVVVDVGGIHDHNVLRYDHHQREFATTFPGRSTKLSSAGLVWMHLGKEIISYITDLPESNPDCELLYQKLYDDFIEAFDANDNGISVYDSKPLRDAGIDKKFSDKGYSIASVVNRYNSGIARIGQTGRLELRASTKPSQKEEDTRFLKASDFAGEQFLLELGNLYQSWLPARALVKQSFAERSQYDADGRILVIPQQTDGGAPWGDHLYNLEKETGCEGQVLYVLFAENGEKDSKWRIRAVSVNSDSFENRKGLPDAWRGVRDEDLSNVAGIPGCIFVHASGFIGGNATFEGALAMAKKAVET